MPVTAGGERSAPATRRVHFVAPSAYPLGGVATWLDHIVPDLAALGWAPQAVLAAGAHHDAAAYERAHPDIAPALRVHAPTGTRQGRVHALVRALAAEPGLIVSVNIPDALLAAAQLKARRRGSRVRAIVSVHGLEPDLYADLARLAPLLDGVICSNRLAQACAMRYSGLEPERVLYAPYGTALPLAQDAHAERPGLYTVGFAGRFERFQKRVQDIPPIAHELNRSAVPVRWLVAGDGPDRDDIRALESVSPGAVEVLGHVPPERMHERFYSRCDALLSTSAWETGPIVIWEAMARGIAVASSRYVGSGREGALAHEQNCLLFTTGDTRAAAECLARLADSGLRSRLAVGGRALVSQRYSRQASARAWSLALSAIDALPPRTGRAPRSPSAGRLDSWLGCALAERARQVARRHHPHADPGGEWPHTHSPAAREDPEHWALLEEIDRAAPSGARGVDRQRP